MLANIGLKDRLKALQLILEKNQTDFIDLKDRLKLAKKEVTNTQGAIIEIERLLLSANT